RPLIQLALDDRAVARPIEVVGLAALVEVGIDGLEGALQVPHEHGDVVGLLEVGRLAGDDTGLQLVGGARRLDVDAYLVLGLLEAGDLVGEVVDVVAGSGQPGGDGDRLAYQERLFTRGATATSRATGGDQRAGGAEGA